MAVIISRSGPETALILVALTGLVALAAFVALERFRINQQKNSS